jgi:hypothetical protein
MGFRWLSMRGVEKAAGEWTLASFAWSVNRMSVLRIVWNGVKMVVRTVLRAVVTRGRRFFIGWNCPCV